MRYWWIFQNTRILSSAQFSKATKNGAILSASSLVMLLSYWPFETATLCLYSKKKCSSKIVLPEPAEFHYSFKKILSYRADTKRSNFFICPMQDDAEIWRNWAPCILSGRGRNQIPSSSIENVITAVVEASSQSPHGNISVPVVFRVLGMLYSMVWKIF